MHESPPALAAAAAAAAARRREVENALLVQALCGRPAGVAACRQLADYIAGRLGRAEAFAALYELPGG